MVRPQGKQVREREEPYCLILNEEFLFIDIVIFLVLVFVECVPVPTSPCTRTPKYLLQLSPRCCVLVEHFLSESLDIFCDRMHNYVGRLWVL